MNKMMMMPTPMDIRNDKDGMISVTLHVADADPKTGKIIGPWTRVANNSWLKQFAQILQIMFSLTAGAVIDTAGASKTLNGYYAGDGYAMVVASAAGSNTFGIQVGSDAVTPTRDDYALGTLIAHGTGAGQLQYGTCVVTTINAITGGYSIEITRAMTNNSGGSITVLETGLVCKITDSVPAATYFLILHDLTGVVAIADGTAKTFKYTINFLV